MTKERVVIKGVSGALLAAATMVSGPAGAVLIDRGGGLIYDDVLDITWLQDANYAFTSGYSAANAVDNGTFATDNVLFAGRMGWDAAVAWADNLVYGGYDDWRLPTTVDTGSPGCDFANSGTDCGYNVQTTSDATVYSEMASLFYDTLGNVGAFDASGAPTGCSPDCFQNTGPFSNIQSYRYWSGTEYALLDGDSAWHFGSYSGNQDAIVGKLNEFFAWAVRPGDVAAAVPEPGTLGLLGASLALLGFGRRRRRHLALP